MAALLFDKHCLIEYNCTKSFHGMLASQLKYLTLKVIQTSLQDARIQQENLTVMSAKVIRWMLHATKCSPDVAVMLGEKSNVAASVSCVFLRKHVRETYL